MLYQWLYPLRDAVSGFNLFRYITFRAACAAITALLISFLLGPWIIRQLRIRQLKQVIREDGPKTHLAKSGTPTMGGLIILISVLVPLLLWADLSNFYVELMIFTTISLGLLGFVDDYLKIVRKLPQGLIARYKMLGQIVIGLVVAVALLKGPYAGDIDRTATTIPFLKIQVLNWGLLFIPMVIFVITGFSNAVNLTDGLDGLAIGLLGISFLAFGLISYVSGHLQLSRYLSIPHLRMSGELTIYCAAVVGASLGFLWFNAKPAKVFMGDIGSLSLGGSLGALAILVKKELLLVVIGAVFVAEAVSVILQVAYYKRTKGPDGKGKRLFRMAPLHHHFELSGWDENTVVVRFWVLGILAALVSLSTFKIR